jgi:hypothetical protein
LSGLKTQTVAFYPYDSSIIEHAAPQTSVARGGEVDMILRRSAVSGGWISTLDGLLLVQNESGRALRALDVSARVE